MNSTDSKRSYINVYYYTVAFGCEKNNITYRLDGYIIRGTSTVAAGRRYVKIETVALEDTIWSSVGISSIAEISVSMDVKKFFKVDMINGPKIIPNSSKFLRCHRGNRIYESSIGTDFR